MKSRNNAVRHVTATKSKPKASSDPYEICLRLEYGLQPGAHKEKIQSMCELFRTHHLLVEVHSRQDKVSQRMVYYLSIVASKHMTARSWCQQHHDCATFITNLSHSARRQQLTLALLTQAIPTFKVWKSEPLDRQLQRVFEAEEALCFPMHHDPERPTFDDLGLGVFHYFGPKVAMYFAWFDHYNLYLLCPSILGLVVQCFERDWVMGLWSFQLLLTCYFPLTFPLFGIYWKRHVAKVEWAWKYAPVDPIEAQANVGFRGEWTVDAVTSASVYDYSWKKRLGVQLGLSFPLCLVMCLGVGAYVWSIEALSGVTTCPTNVSSWICRHIPSMLNVVCIKLWNASFLYLAKTLTTLENYRTAQGHERALYIKLLPFDLINHHASLVYCLFVKHDVEQFHSRLWVWFIFTQYLDSIQALVWNVLRHEILSMCSGSSVSVLDLCKKHTIERLEHQAQALSGESTTTTDFRDRILQCSVVAWYTPMFPLAPVLALSHNLMQIRLDRWKVRHALRRPWAENAHGIEHWYVILQGVVGTLSVLFHASMLSKEQQLPSWSCLVVEHVVLGWHALLYLGFPQVPSWATSAQRRVRLNAYADKTQALVQAHELQKISSIDSICHWYNRHHWHHHHHTAAKSE